MGVLALQIAALNAAYKLQADPDALQEMVDAIQELANAAIASGAEL